MMALAHGRWLLAICSATPVLTSCASSARTAHRPRGAIVGQQSDLTVARGAVDGYFIETQCSRSNCVGVRGLAGGRYSGMERERITEEARFRAAFDRFRQEITKSTDVQSIHHSGFGSGCSEPGLWLSTNDWHDVSHAVQQIGTKLAQDHLSEEVTVCIESDSDVEL